MAAGMRSVVSGKMLTIGMVVIASLFPALAADMGGNGRCADHQLRYNGYGQVRLDNHLLGTKHPDCRKPRLPIADDAKGFVRWIDRGGQSGECLNAFCTDFVDTRMAEVVCRELGLGTFRTLDYMCTPGGLALTTNVFSCNGSESSLRLCNRTRLPKDQMNCNTHSEAYIVCSGRTGERCRDTCPESFYPYVKSDEGDCRPCPATCATCAGRDNCTRCQPGCRRKPGTSSRCSCLQPQEQRTCSGNTSDDCPSAGNLSIRCPLQFLESTDAVINSSKTISLNCTVFGNLVTSIDWDLPAAKWSKINITSNSNNDARQQALKPSITWTHMQATWTASENTSLTLRCVANTSGTSLTKLYNVSIEPATDSGEVTATTVTEAVSITKHSSQSEAKATGQPVTHVDDSHRDGVLIIAIVVPILAISCLAIVLLYYARRDGKLSRLWSKTPSVLSTATLSAQESPHANAAVKEASV